MLNGKVGRQYQCLLYIIICCLYFIIRPLGIGLFSSLRATSLSLFRRWIENYDIAIYESLSLWLWRKINCNHHHYHHHERHERHVHPSGFLLCLIIWTIFESNIAKNKKCFDNSVTKWKIRWVFRFDLITFCENQIDLQK